MLPNQDRSTLKDILSRRSLLTSGDFTLASGEKSSVYVDGKLTTCFSHAMPLVGRVFIRKIQEQNWSPEAVGGLTVGADPIAFAIARESLNFPPAIDAFIVRKVAKEHGRHKFIEGLEDPKGRRVVIIDDICTKGGSTGQAIEKAQEAGMHIVGVACLVDRQQGATEYLQGKFGFELQSIFTLNELLTHKHEQQLLADPVEA